MNKLPNLPINHQTVKPYTFVPVLGISTTVESPLQIDPFMQNKANFRKSQMNVTIYSQMAYENKSNWTLGENKPNSNPIKANTKPIQTQTKPKQTQYKPNQSQFQRQKNMSGCPKNVDNY